MLLLLSYFMSKALLKFTSRDFLFFTGPASKQVLVREGDILSQINGVDVSGFSLSQISPHILGPPGSRVCCIFLRGDESITVDLERAYT